MSPSKRIETQSAVASPGKRPFLALPQGWWREALIISVQTSPRGTRHARDDVRRHDVGHDPLEPFASGACTPRSCRIDQVRILPLRSSAAFVRTNDAK